MITSGGEPSINLIFDERFAYTVLLAIVSYLIGFGLCWIINKAQNEGEDYVNLNDLATFVAKQEGLKKSTDVAQVKEVMRIIFHRVAGMSRRQVNSILNRHKVTKI